MTKNKTTKHALLTNLLLLLMLISMLIGTTFAWFTDSVTSSGNIIKSGSLKVTMEWADGTENPETANWKNAARDAIFNNNLWEPGYTEVRHIRIQNIGTLALKYVINILPNGEVTDLANVIDVYYIDPATQVLSRTDLNESNKLGVLSEVLKNIPSSARGELPAGEADTITLALKMRESADNTYQNKSLGTDFSVQLSAAQLTSEKDSFDNQYDAATLVTNAEELKSALAEGEKIILPDGSIYEEPEDAIVVWDTAELTSAIKKANNGNTVFLAAGDYTLPQITKTDVKDFTIIGTSLTNVANDTAKTNYFSNFTFENITFTNNIVAKFAGNSTIKNCTFISNGVEAQKQCTVVSTAILTVEGCTFNGVDRIKNLHFGGNDGGTVVVKDCVFNRGYVAFGKAMNITLENCDFNGGVASCYGSYIFNNCTFDADAQVYIHANTGATEVNLTMNDCTVDGGADVTSVCYNTGNNNGGVKTFTIDGKLYNHDELQAFPSN